LVLNGPGKRTALLPEMHFPDKGEDLYDPLFSCYDIVLTLLKVEGDN
tara:strand:+ start:600 stop:740 length:141 start_codon:yes stop_codon:yes gene_type:complete